MASKRWLVLPLIVLIVFCFVVIYARTIYKKLEDAKHEEDIRNHEAESEFLKWKYFGPDLLEDLDLELKEVKYDYNENPT